MALFSKESAVIFPFAYWLAILVRPDLPPKHAVYALLMLVPYGILRSLHMAPHPTLFLPGTARFLIEAFPKIAWHYGALSFVPWNLQSWPPITTLSHLWPVYWFFWGLLGWVCWKTMARQGLFCIAWIWLFLLPKTPALMNNGVMMDHWIFDSLLGLLLIPVSLGQRLVDVDRPWLRRCLGGLVGVVLILWTGLCHYGLSTRGSDELNYRWTLKFASQDFALYRLGIILIERERSPEALNYLEKLCRQSPGQADYENALALACIHTRSYTRAETLLRNILQRQPSYSPAQKNLALLAKQRNQIR
jgi:hypothetical protein